MKTLFTLLATALLVGCAAPKNAFTLYPGDKLIFVDVERAEQFRDQYGIEPNYDGRVVVLRQYMSATPSKPKD